MKILILSFFLLCSTTSLFAKQKAIYGEDNRVNIFESPTQWQEIASSVAVMFPNEYIDTSAELDFYPIATRTHMQENDVCIDERFAKEPAVAYCSGFLVAPDLLVTAAHCMGSSDLKKNRWVFGWGYFDSLNEKLNKTEPDNVYRAVEIVERKIDSSGADYLLVRLDREVKDRKPLTYRKEGKISKGTPLAVIGAPSGLPLKFADGAVVHKTVGNIYALTDLDTYSGNSGSPVFNAKTYEIEGILVRGADDYYYDKKAKCMRSAHCTITTCRGEDVVLISNIKALFE